jgi:hypothetical protein
MKTAIKMFLGFGSIRKRRSKLEKIRAFRVDYFGFSNKKIEKLV